METLIKSSGRPALVDADGQRIELPGAIFDVLVHVIQSMKQGRSIIMLPEDETFTTQAAANFLGVSRQYLVNLLEEGGIPHHKVGSHRRIYFRDLKAFADQRDKKRREILDDLFDEVAGAGKNDTRYTGK
ncbi:MAG: helix-turn-helix domain-containing protein [Balneolales bacterium]